MNVCRILDVREGDTMSAFRHFVSDLWATIGLDAILAPVEVGGEPGVMVREVTEQENLLSLNPFAPVMAVNGASACKGFIQNHPEKRLAVIMRPCELRAFYELVKRRPGEIDPSAFLIIGVDCLGTFSVAEYARLVEKLDTARILRETFINAAEGGFRSQRFRTACQVCDWPAPRGADITIGTIGVASDQYLLVIANDEGLDEKLGLDKITAGLATEYQVSRRETVVGAVADTHAGVRRQMIEDTKRDSRFNGFGSILAWLANCTLCGRCLDACPLTSKRSVDRNVLAQLVEISRWLASCSGCGMCEQACDEDVPLTLITSGLSHHIRGEIKYKAGDPHFELPWACR